MDVGKVDLFYMVWGVGLIVVYYGDCSKLECFVLEIVDICFEWFSMRYRYVFMGYVYYM